MAKKLITIAIPTDFPPYGFVGTDLQAAGPGHRHGQLIAAKLGVKVELVPVTSANRIPYLQTQEGRPRHLHARQERRAREGDRLHVAYSPFFQAVFAPKSAGVEERRPTWPARRRA